MVLHVGDMECRTDLETRQHGHSVAHAIRVHTHVDAQQTVWAEFTRVTNAAPLAVPGVYIGSTAPLLDVFVLVGE